MCVSVSCHVLGTEILVLKEHSAILNTYPILVTEGRQWTTIALDRKRLETIQPQ